MSASSQTGGRQSTTPSPRERILAAARELFYRRGIHAVGVDAIAETAGTNKMTLYRHFASKDALVAACLSELTQEFDAAWNVIAAAHIGDPKGQLVAWLRHIATLRSTKPSVDAHWPMPRSSFRNRITRLGVLFASIKPRHVNS